MKSASAVLASILFGSVAVAAPFERRDLVTKTNTVVETVVVYTTVWKDPAPSSIDGLFFEQPPTTVITATEVIDVFPTPTPTPEKKPTPVAPAPVETPKTSSKIVSSQTPKAPAPVAPSSSPAAAPVAAQPTTTQAAAAAPAAVAASPAPEPVTSQAPQASQPETQQQQQPSQAAQPAASQPSSSSGGSTSSGGATYSDVDITIYDNNGGFGACGTELHDGDMIVALAQSAWGASTYDVMTGAATNPWCGQKINIQYEGNSIQATIMDMCPGCSGHDIDLSLAAWKALTGKDEKTRLKASWSKA